MLYRKRGKAMMDMKFSPDWLRRVAKEEEDVRFSVGGWTSGIIRPGGEDCPCHCHPVVMWGHKKRAIENK
jgi:hypothetical protein